MGSFALSTLTLGLTILSIPHQAQAQTLGYGCPNDCSECPSYSGGTGGPYVPQLYCDSAENCFAGYQCFLEFGAPNIIISNTPGQDENPTWYSDQDPNCCTPVDTCQFTASDPAGSLIDYDFNGTSHDATDTTAPPSVAPETDCPVYCVDCFEGKYTSDDSSGNPSFTCKTGCSTFPTTSCIPPVPGTCLSDDYPIKGGNCSVVILQYEQESTTQDWFPFNIYFYDALWVFAKSPNPETIMLLTWALIAQMPFYMTGNITVDVDGDIEFSLPRLQTGAAVIFSLSTYKGTNMLGLEFNGVAWGVGDVGDTMIPYTNGMRNVTSKFACQPATTCRGVVNVDGQASEEPTC